MTAEEALAKLAGLTGLSPQEWQDFLSLPPTGQELCVQGYKDQSWTQTPDTFAEVLAVLAMIGSIAGVVGGVAGAASAVAALRAL